MCSAYVGITWLDDDDDDDDERERKREREREEKRKRESLKHIARFKPAAYEQSNIEHTWTLQAYQVLPQTLQAYQVLSWTLQLFKRAMIFWIHFKCTNSPSNVFNSSSATGNYSTVHVLFVKCSSVQEGDFAFWTVQLFKMVYFYMNCSTILGEVIKSSWPLEVFFCIKFFHLNCSRTLCNFT